MYVVGDIHGNIDSLLRILERFGYPPESLYLFLGDYIDRGRNSCEVILILYSLKFLFPGSVHLIRGNHEFRAMSEWYGFRWECESRLSRALFELIIRSFDFLPIAARLGGNFCVHGGISPELKSPADLARIGKSGGDDSVGLVCDLLWSDPRSCVRHFKESPRGCGFLFGEDAVRSFRSGCPRFERVVRAHESCPEGFNWPFDEGGSVLTIFSSCDYCDTMNDAAVVFLSDSDTSATCTKMPPIRPGQADRRGVTYPIWLIEEPSETVKPELATACEVEIVI
jgi:protein phosphatase